MQTIQAKSVSNARTACLSNHRSYSARTVLAAHGRSRAKWLVTRSIDFAFTVALRSTTFGGNGMRSPSGDAPGRTRGGFPVPHAARRHCMVRVWRRRPFGRLFIDWAVQRLGIADRKTSLVADSLYSLSLTGITSTSARSQRPDTSIGPTCLRQVACSGPCEASQHPGRAALERGGGRPAPRVAARQHHCGDMLARNAPAVSRPRRRGGCRVHARHALHRADADQEIILTAGAFNSPQQLVFSGIGLARELEGRGRSTSGA